MAGITYTFVSLDPEIAKCSNANCPNDARARNEVTTELLAIGESGVHLWTRNYFCDACYPRYKKAADQLREADSAEGPEKYHTKSDLRALARGEFFIHCDCPFCLENRRKAGIK